MKKARILLALIIATSCVAGALAFKARSSSPVYFYCTTQYGAPGLVNIYPTIALPTIAYCTHKYSYACYKYTVVSFDFNK